MQPQIIYEDEYILALDKPAGLLVHPVAEQVHCGTGSDDGKNELTLTDWILKNYPELKNVGETQTLQNGQILKRPGIVHRLDKDTSGVIIVAKTKEAFEFLKKQFQDRKVEKIYNAIVWRNFSPEKMKGIINKLIGRSNSDFRKWSAEGNPKGELREAITEYRVLNQNNNFAYLEVRPKTGRTHQIRVHLKSIGHPVICDKLYGCKKSPTPIQILNFNRLALHAVSIKLELPNGQSVKIESELPKEFENAKNLLKTDRK